MLLIIGSYRGRRHMADCLRSIDQHVSGVTELVIIDDSGDPDVRVWLAQYGQVVDGGQGGYAHTMQLACEHMQPPYTAWWEEDFTATAAINLDALAEELDHNPQLAQIVLLRQPWFADEHAAGGVIQHLRTTHRVDTVRGRHQWLHKHQAIFSTNPGVWSPEAWFWGWPQCRGSEDVKTMQLRDHDGLEFATTTAELVHHDGIRTGHGY